MKRHKEIRSVPHEVDEETGKILTYLLLIIHRQPKKKNPMRRAMWRAWNYKWDRYAYTKYGISYE